MTMVLVVACQDSFYLVADTRTQDTATNTTSDNTQKVFHSNKHKLGLCVSGDAMLPDPYDSTNTQKTMSVSYIMFEFFKGIEGRSIASLSGKINTIDDFFRLIQNFIKSNFGDRYVVPFLDHVSVFLAAMINGETVIGSYLAKQAPSWETFNYATEFSTKLCAFSNYQILADKYSKDMINLPSCTFSGSEVEKQNQYFSLSDPRYRISVLNNVFDGARQAVLQTHPDSIGEYFHYIKIAVTDTDFKDLKYQSDGNNIKFVDVGQGDYFPHYQIFKTQAEFDANAQQQQPIHP